MKCMVKGCSKRHHAKGYCSTHYRLSVPRRRKGEQRAAKRGEPLKFLLDICSKPLPDNCIVWPYGRDSYGYGSLRVNGGSVTAHRKSLSLYTGENPEGLHACHGDCHEPLCVNPAHLSWKMPKGNQGDRLRDGTDNRGEKCGSSILDRDQVTEIRRLLLDGFSSYRIAKSYPVSAAAIRAIKEGRTWGWHEDEYSLAMRAVA